jgi:anti-sigma regulatory factor (Ser/Thr protein kinase)
MDQCHIRISATQRELGPVATKVEEFCAKNNIPAATSNLVNLALDEVLSNIVNYAYEAEQRGLIDVGLAYAQHTLTATVEDSGKPFDPLQFQRPIDTRPLKTRRHGGLGILFVKRLVDNVRYHRSGDRNTLTLVVKVPSK